MLKQQLKRARRFREVAEELRNLASDADCAEDREVLEQAAVEFDRLAESEIAKCFVRLHG